MPNDSDLLTVPGSRFTAAMAAQDLVDAVESIRRGKIDVVIPGNIGDPPATVSLHDVSTVFMRNIDPLFFPHDAHIMSFLKMLMIMALYSHGSPTPHLPA